MFSIVSLYDWAKLLFGSNWINQFKKTVNGLCIISLIGVIDPLKSNFANDWIVYPGRVISSARTLVAGAVLLFVRLGENSICTLSIEKILNAFKKKQKIYDTVDAFRTDLFFVKLGSQKK